MNFLDSFIISPTASQIHTSSYIILISLLIQLPYYSLLLGFTLSALAFDLLGKRDKNPAFLRFSELLLNAFTFNKYAIIIFGFIPVLSLYLSLSQFLYGSDIKVSYFFSFLLPSLTVSLVLAYLYHRTAASDATGSVLPLLLGTMSVAFLVLSSYTLISIISFVKNFEMRLFTQSLSQLLLTWSSVTRYLLYLSLTIAVTGAGALLFFGDWLGGPKDLDEEVRKVTEGFGTGAIYTAIVLIPLFTVTNFVALPDIALSVPTILLTLLFFAILVSSFFMLQRARKELKTLLTPLLFVTLLASYSVATVNDVLSIENSTKEHVKNLVSQAEKKSPTAAAKAEKASPESSVAELEEEGEMIFKSRCSACHKFDERLVGPPFLQVLPKYRDNRDKLVSFILNPTKINPGYPPMPNLGLARKDVEAVAQYVMKRLDEEAKM